MSTTISDRMLDGPHGPLRVRVYAPATPAGPGLVWAHGGAFAGGDLDMPEADEVARRLADRCIAVVSVDYHRAPVPRAWVGAADDVDLRGVHYPVASEEVGFAFTWATTADLASGPWALGGASAGGNLATGATLRLVRQDGPQPALVVLAYPTLHAVQPAASAALRAALDAGGEADRIGPDALRAMYENYLGGPVDDADIFAVPGLATASELDGFPATIIVNSEVDELRISGAAFADALHGAGVAVDVSTEPGTRHGHLNERDDPAAHASIERLAHRLLATTTGGAS